MATQVQEWFCFILFRFIMPSVLLISTVIRFNIYSLIYSFLMLANALLSRPTYHTMSGMTGKFLIIATILTSLTLLSQSIFQIYTAVVAKQQDQLSEDPISVSLNIKFFNNSSNNSNFNNSSFFPKLSESINANFSDYNCTLPEHFFTHLGLQKIDLENPVNVARILGPDIFSFLISSVTLFCCLSCLTKPSSCSPIEKQICKCSDLISFYLGNLTTVVLIATVGILLPSLINMVYFFLVIISMTMWSLVVNRRHTWFQRIRFVTIFYTGFHLLAIYLRQFPVIVELWTNHVIEGSLIDRLLLLPQFIETSSEGCSRPQFISLRTSQVPPLAYTQLPLIIILYFVLAAEIRRWMNKMKFFSVRSIITANNIHQNILLKNPEENRNTSDGTTQASNHSSECSGNLESSLPLGSPDNQKNVTFTTFSSMGAIKDYILKQSYIGTLIVMMVWSITYHSWMTFVLLLAACIIWVMPPKRSMCLKCSPIILTYALCLLIIQYLYGLNLTGEELPSAFGTGYELQDIGLVKYKNSADPLAIKLLFTCMFWLTLRHARERRSGHGDQSPEIMLEPLGIKRNIIDLAAQSRESEMVRNIGLWLWHTMCKYWIFACAALFLFISLQEAVVYRLVYMIMFLYFVITFQVSYKFWRLSIKVFLWVVIIYSMVVLVCIYTFQFKGFPQHWKSVVGVSDKMLLNLGLKTIDTTELFIDLLTPTSFLIVVSIQLHYFQNDFLKMSDLNRFKSMDSNPQERRQTSDSNTRRGKRDRVLLFCTYLWTRFYQILETFSAVMWRFVEIHIFKVTVSTIFICCVCEVSALNTLLVLVAVILLPFPRLHNTMLILEMILSSAILLFKMIYQMDIIENDVLSSNCSEAWFNQSDDKPPPFKKPLNNTNFIGILKAADMAQYLMIYIIMILMLSLQAIVRCHQVQYFRHPSHSRPMDGIVFKNTKRFHADQGLTQCFKFFVNYFFYKFGKELCFIVTMATMVIRLDMYSVVYGVFLGILLLLHRKQCAFIWPIYIVTLVILLIAQYLSCVGLPPALCWAYPWDKRSLMSRNLKIFLYLPDYENPPWPLKLICDYFQLLFACLQWNVFHIEANKLEEFGGGDNDSIIERLNKKNPQSDFLSYKDSYLDYLKTVVFFYSFWVTLMVVFISGMSRISLFCMGYLIGCFVFLWFGEGMLLKHPKKLTNMWMGLLMYCYLVLLAKCVLQLFGCVYISLLSNTCWVIQLFNIVCLKSFDYILCNSSYEYSCHDINCRMSVDEAGLSWDALCFVFLLLMLRIFKTWYFQHVVNELKINNMLAARGAQLINNKLIDDINLMKANEERVLHHIRTKMDRIRIKHGDCMSETIDPERQSVDHYTIIRSGDYYMFNNVAEDDMEPPGDGDTISEMEEEGGKENEDWRNKKSNVPTANFLATALFGAGPKEALNLIEKSGNFSRSMSIGSAKDYTTPEGEMINNTFGNTSPSSQLDGTSSTIVGDPDMEDPRLFEKYEPSSALSLPSNLPLFIHQNALSHPKSVKISDIMPPVPEGNLESETTSSVRGSKTPDQPRLEFLEEQDKDELELKDETTKKVETGLKMLQMLIISLINFLIQRINNSTRHYRSVSLKLHEEKEREKLLNRDLTLKMSREDEKTDGNLLDGHAIKDDEITNRKRKENEFHNTMPRIIVLVIAIFEALVARTDLLCYFAMILNAMMSASVFSLVYPISVFFWGMLSVPRPTKFYWVAAITYTELIIVIKYLFQFNFYPWNQNPPGTENSQLLNFPAIIGIEKKEMYAALDFFVLFCLFIHRMMLKKRGLWTPSHKDESDKNSPKLKNQQHKQTNTEILGSGDNLDTHTDISQTTNYNNLCYRVCGPVRTFYKHITNPKYSAMIDVFALMFALDLFTFLIVVFGYNKFGPSEQLEDSDVASVIQQSRVPVPFLLMLLVQFLLIVVDRALYLRKLIFGKFIFHIFLVIVVHVWMFFLLPIITDIPFEKNQAAQLWYFTKCIYFGLSCYQVRSGYPIRTTGNFLTKKFGYFNLFCFKGFLAIPFLLELRALTDWMWSDTTLALTSWLQMEDIYANVFVLKCWRKIEKDSPTPRAIPRHPVVKYGLGGLVLFLLIFVIWFPLLIFSMSNSIYEPNPPTSILFTLSISGPTSSQPIFTVVSQKSQLTPISHEDYLQIRNIYLQKPKSMAFLNVHREEDIYKIYIGGTSTKTWEISYPSEQNLIKDLEDMNNMSFTVDITINREPPTNNVVASSVSVHFTRTLNSSLPQDKETLEKLAKMINGSYDESVTVDKVFPRYLTVPARRKANETGVLYYETEGMAEWSSINLTLQQKKEDKSRWWEMKEVCRELMKRHDHQFCEWDNINRRSLIVAFSERIPTGVLTLVNNYGVIGLYVSVILVIGRFVRMQSVGNIHSIMFTNLPYVERVYNLCLDIYLVRQAREFAFEELLFAKLNFLYRSPETMIKWTRHPKIKSD